MLGSLVAYKGKPAEITAQTPHKFDLKFADGTICKVRAKDFRLLHPDFKPVNDNPEPPDLTILKDFKEQTLSLAELTEWLFDKYCAQNAWQVYQLVEDGLYFYWQKERIFIRPDTQVQAIKAKRKAAIIEAKNIQNCIQNIQKNCFADADLAIIQQIEKVALNQSKHAKILNALGLKSTPEVAHQLLLKIRYWTQAFNPYPQRNKILADEALNVDDITTKRLDLTALHSFAIDNNNANDADDAISVDGDKIWVHIADTAHFATANSALDLYAKQRISNLYLPDEVRHMLPLALIKLCALKGERANTLSIGFSINDSNKITNIIVAQSIIKVQNISYNQADKIISSNPYLAKLQKIATNHKAYRHKNGAIQLNLPNVDVKLADDKVVISEQTNSKSREMVAEMMILAGRVVAQFATEQKIPMPYVGQDEGNFTEQILADKTHLSLSQLFTASKCFGHSKITSTPKKHAGLGLDAYIRITSPLRRYLDLVAHQQLLGYINNNKCLSAEQLKMRIIKTNSMITHINKTNKNSDEHFKCLYLIQNPSWRGEAVVVDKRGNKVLLIIPTVSMMTQIKPKTTLNLDDKITVKAANIDLVNRVINFKPV